MGEAKIFESDGFVVTTERFVYGSKVVFLDDIQGGALPIIDKGWTGMITIGVIGLAIFGCGLSYRSVLAILIGILFLVGAYFFLQGTVMRTVVLSLKSGEGLQINVSTTELATNLANAINAGIGERHRLRNNALHDELSNLPSV